uniref:Uncharacterized protein n=1 Tax=Oryza sativa subsp. japonica TaxID=39947 RepID=Q6YXU7_ORYSJ|nr:hypothetical protein [Oryza sativa Japonica Group]BAD13251.1 hypothetical protein [Oryza sativa Japonica Group]
MGSKDGFSDNKLFDDFAVGRSNPTEVCLPTRSEPSSSTTRSLEIDQTSRYAAYQKTSDHMMSNKYAIHPACIYKDIRICYELGHKDLLELAEKPYCLY